MDTRERLATVWPQFGLKIRSDQLELRSPDDDDLVDLARLAVQGIHDPAFMPFNTAWTDVPPDELMRNVIEHGWKARGDFSPERWALPLAVVVGGEVAGVQDIRAEHFAVRRSVSTGSWLGRRFQNRGIGTAMRAAVLHLAFEGLDAVDAESASRIGNESSARVSTRIGYLADGIETKAIRDERAIMQRWRLTREQWRERDRPRVEIAGLDRCLPFFVGERYESR